ncbi:MAG: hypothetical protein Q7S22_08195 [Candidatus Micrarchaeota archaeon]|nr:hypothetical protein [Candidatus Micrarchaeota archaeon]
MNMATKIKAVRANPIKSPLKDVLLSSLREYSEIGSTTIDGKRFTPDRSFELAKFLFKLSLGHTVGAVIIPVPEKKPVFVVGDKVHSFGVKNETTVIILANCETNLVDMPYGSPFLGYVPNQGFVPLGQYVFVDGVERILTQPKNPLTFRVLERLGPDEALNTVLFDAINADNVYMNLVANAKDVRDQDIRGLMSMILSTEPLIAFLEWLTNVPPETKTEILRSFGIEREEQLFSIEAIPLRVKIGTLANNLVSSYLKKHGYPNIAELIDTQAIADIGLNVFGGNFGASVVLVQPK